jgi:hypothetical protein
MRRSLLLWLTTLALAVALTARAGNEGCPHDLYPPYEGTYTGTWQLTGGSAATTYYVDDRGFVDGGGTWIYAESNGDWQEKLPGVYHAAHVWDQDDLQPGGCTPWVPTDCENEPCDPNEPPDTILF